nr:hypothetical protein [uncultured Acetatifactor sp.]
MFISKKQWRGLEKRVADLEKKQSQPSGKGLSLTEQAFLLAALNIKLSNVLKAAGAGVNGW